MRKKRVIKKQVSKKTTSGKFNKKPKRTASSRGIRRTKPGREIERLEVAPIAIPGLKSFGANKYSYNGHIFTIGEASYRLLKKKRISSWRYLNPYMYFIKWELGGARHIIPYKLYNFLITEETRITGKEPKVVDLTRPKTTKKKNFGEKRGLKPIPPRPGEKK